MRLTQGDEVLALQAVADPDAAVLVTVSGSGAALPGTDMGSVKVTPLALYPDKGRGTQGVRCHRFRKGEDTLLWAWAGPAPARACTVSGTPVDLPEPDDRRDGTGTSPQAPIDAVGPSL